jgi:hypothetical protein
LRFVPPQSLQCVLHAWHWLSNPARLDDVPSADTATDFAPVPVDIFGKESPVALYPNATGLEVHEPSAGRAPFQATTGSPQKNAFLVGCLIKCRATRIAASFAKLPELVGRA